MEKYKIMLTRNHNQVLGCVLIFLATMSFSYETDMEHHESCSISLFKLSMFSKQNENGKWETHVQLNRDNQTDNMRMNKDLHLNVKQTVVACNCTHEIVNVVADIVAPPLPPGKNYTYETGLGYYFLHKTPYDWSEANYFCNMDDAHLSIINSQLKAEYVKKLIKENLTNGSQIFTGTKKTTNGNIESLYGEVYNLPTGLEWQNLDGLINDTTTDYCGTITYEGKQNLVPCNQKLPFICEQEE